MTIKVLAQCGCISSTPEIRRSDLNSFPLRSRTTWVTIIELVLYRTYDRHMRPLWIGSHSMCFRSVSNATEWEYRQGKDHTLPPTSRWHIFMGRSSRSKKFCKHVETFAIERLWCRWSRGFYGRNTRWGWLRVGTHGEERNTNQSWILSGCRTRMGRQFGSSECTKKLRCVSRFHCRFRIFNNLSQPWTRGAEAQDTTRNPKFAGLQPIQRIYGISVYRGGAEVQLPIWIWRNCIFQGTLRLSEKCIPSAHTNQYLPMHLISEPLGINSPNIGDGWPNIFEC